MKDDPLALRVACEADVAHVRFRACELAQRQGLSPSAISELGTAVSEIARNIFDHAGDGTVDISSVRSGRRVGVRIVARDSGPGIESVELAMKDGYSTGAGLGIGLPSARRLVDELELTSSVGKGTTVTLVKWRQ